MPRYLTEFIGTFFLVLSIGLSGAAGPLAPLAIGFTLMVVVYMGGHVSGAHYNPAVTLAVALRGKMEKRDIAPYVIAQLLGAVLAGLTAALFIGQGFGGPVPFSEISIGTTIVGEAIWTFLLALVILNVATANSTEGNSYFGLAIGFTVAAGAFVMGPISGGGFNPAVSIGPALVNAVIGDGHALASVWIYIVGPCIGGALAAFAFKAMNPNDEVVELSRNFEK
jgi:aquaporin Z